ncbi:TPA: hypothetical protein ACNTSU_003732, partial [Escherichia coli]
NNENQTSCSARWHTGGVAGFRRNGSRKPGKHEDYVKGFFPASGDHKGDLQPGFIGGLTDGNE